MAGVYVDGGQLNARHWTLDDNGAYGVYVDAGTAELDQHDRRIAHDGGILGCDTADHTLFFGNGAACGGTATCTHSLSGSPLFVDPAAGDYHLLPDRRRWMLARMPA